MNEQYVAPELKLVGSTEEVILGGWDLGGDWGGMSVYSDMEFSEDK